MIRPIRIAAAIALLCAATGCATSYGGSNAGGLFGGQKATRLDANSWEIYSGANGYSAADFAQNSALYKAALVARAGGFPYFQIYRFEIYLNSNGYGGQDAKLRMHPLATPYAPFVCESARFRENCRTLSTDATIALTESLIHRTPEQTAAEVASMRTQFGLSPLTDEQLLAEAERARAATRLQREATAEIRREAVPAPSSRAGTRAIRGRRGPRRRRGGQPSASRNCPRRPRRRADFSLQPGVTVAVY